MLSLFFFRRKSTTGLINKQISKTHKAFKAFIKVKDKLDKANEQLSTAIQKSIQDQEALELAAVREKELQEVALDRIADNMSAIEQIDKLIGVKK